MKDFVLNIYFLFYYKNIGYILYPTSYVYLPSPVSADFCKSKNKRKINFWKLWMGITSLSINITCLDSLSQLFRHPREAKPCIENLKFHIMFVVNRDVLLSRMFYKKKKMRFNKPIQYCLDHNHTLKIISSISASSTNKMYKRCF